MSQQQFYETKQRQEEWEEHMLAMKTCRCNTSLHSIEKNRAWLDSVMKYLGEKRE